VPKLEPKSNASLSLQENFCDQFSVYKYLYVTETLCGQVRGDWYLTENSLKLIVFRRKNIRVIDGKNLVRLSSKYEGKSEGKVPYFISTK